MSITIVLDLPLIARAALALLGLALVFSCLCRARHMTHRTTITAVRFATTALAGAGFVLVLAALLRPDWMLGALLALAAATLAVQIVSARYWRYGLPASFHRSSR